MQNRKADIVIAVMLLLVCGIFFNATFYFRAMPLSLIPSSLWPRVVLAALLLFSLVYFVRSLLIKEVPDDRQSLGVKAWIFANRNIVWCFGLFIAFLVTLPYLGMLLGGILFVFTTLTAMGTNEWRSHIVNAITAVLSVGGMWAIFTFGLNVILPEGQIFRFF